MLIEWMASSPLLLMFVTCGVGFALGRIPIFGVRFGIAAVLFAGLAISGIDQRLMLPDIVYRIGLVLFVYLMGLNCGPTFFLIFRKSGLRDNAIALVAILSAAVLSSVLGGALHLPPVLSAGMFAGSLTNTPALAAVLEQLKSGSITDISADPVVAYSLAYPFGVVGMILALLLFKPRGQKDVGESRNESVLNSQVISRTVQIPETDGTLTPLSFRARMKYNVILGRVKRGSEVRLAVEDFRFQEGDLVSVIGSSEEVALAGAALGKFVEEDLTTDRYHYEHRRIFVSDPTIEGMTPAKLKLMEQFGALITRIRRGDVDFVAANHNRIRLGDRVRVIAPRAEMPAVTRFFGDSYRAMSEIDIAALSFGIVAGLLLGMLPIPLPGGHVFRFGFAGGPLIMGILFGALGKTGPICWDLPYSANVGLRQLGLVLFLAGVGTKSGFAFFDTLQQGGGTVLLLGGAAITFATALFTLAAGRWIFKIPFPALAGILAGVQTQPAVLAFATDLTDDERTDVGYSTVYPVATLAKLILVQWILSRG